jgi:hypothetical protein
MLLYVQPLIRIAALKTTAIVLTPQVLRISLGAEPIPVPEPFAGLLRFRRPHCKRPGCRHRGKRPGTTTALTATIDNGQHRRQAQEPGRASRRAPSGSPNGQSAMAALSTPPVAHFAVWAIRQRAWLNAPWVGQSGSSPRREAVAVMP